MSQKFVNNYYKLWIKEWHTMFFFLIHAIIILVIKLKIKGNGSKPEFYIQGLYSCSFVGHLLKVPGNAPGFLKVPH